MNRTVFLVDGFNLYHSVKDAQFDLGGSGTKWLDLHHLCQSYLQIIGSDAQLTSVYYFSALAEHLEATKADVTERHRLYLDCLRETGVIVELASSSINSTASALKRLKLSKVLNNPSFVGCG